MPATQQWKPVIEQRPHAYGEEGVRSSLDEVAKAAAKGAVHPRVVVWARNTVEAARRRGLPVKKPRDRAVVLLAAVQKKLWIPDPVGAEFIAGPHLLACDDESDGQVCIRSADCFPENTLLLTEGHELVPVEALRPGMKIWGLDKWSSVEAVAYKGLLPVDVIKLNNGSELKLTSDHHAYVLDCNEHPMLDSDGRALPPDRAWRGGGNGERAGCSCDLSKRTEKRVRVAELRPGMSLPQPKRIPFGEGKHTDAPAEHQQAYIEGLYISDGWADYQYNNRFSISGQDGCPKEDQKKEVQKICEAFGIHTGWRRKSIEVHHKEWTLRVQRMGRYASEKHLLTLDLDEARAAASLRGVMADSGKNTKADSRTFTTTSYLLAVQVRVLHKMFGINCGWRYIENHGGLGKNPIWRVGTRANQRADDRAAWRLKVKRIDRAVAVVPCWDIQTDDHRVYLPEHDVTVSNCDELCALFAAATSAVGIHTMIVGHAYDSKQQIEHVLAAVHVDGSWLRGDPSTDLPLGKYVPFSRERLLSIPNVQVLCDARSCIGREPFDPDQLNFVDKGVYVGVDGPPEAPVGLAAPVVWVTELTPGDLGEIVAAASGLQWLGATLIDLKDPQTLAEVKVMMSMIKPDYLNQSPTWSPADWDAYSKIIAAVAEQAGSNKNSSVAYVQDGSVVTGWPPAGTVGFPNFDGIKKMAGHVFKLNQAENANGGNAHPASEQEFAKYFPKIASYGISATSVTAPTFGVSPSSGKGGGSALPLVLGALALGVAGLALMSGRKPELAANCGAACCENPLCDNPLHRH